MIFKTFTDHQKAYSLQISTPWATWTVVAGYFNKPAISKELWEILKDANSWQHLKVIGPQLIGDMLGVTSTTLKQLCSRVILRQLSRTQNSELSLHSNQQYEDSPTKMSLHSNQLPPGQNQDSTTKVSLYSKQKSEYLTSPRLGDLVKMLRLPQSCVQCFETELLVWQLCKTIKTYDWHGTQSSEDYSTDSDDSDTEYW